METVFAFYSETVFMCIGLGGLDPKRDPPN
jgi:hypothetical protein